MRSQLLGPLLMGLVAFCFQGGRASADHAKSGGHAPPANANTNPKNRADSAGHQHLRHQEHAEHREHHLQQLTARFDANGDGKLDATERDAAKKAIAEHRDHRRAEAEPLAVLAVPSEGRERLVAVLLKRFDTNGDGKLDAAEIEAAKKVIAEMRILREQEAAAADNSDQGQGGSTAAFNPAQGRALGELLKKFDANGDGKLDASEVQSAKKAMAEHWAKEHKAALARHHHEKLQHERHQKELKAKSSAHAAHAAKTHTAQASSHRAKK